MTTSVVDEIGATTRTTAASSEWFARAGVNI